MVFNLRRRRKERGKRQARMMPWGPSQTALTIFLSLSKRRNLAAVVQFSLAIRFPSLDCMHRSVATPLASFSPLLGHSVETNFDLGDYVLRLIGPH